MTFKLIGQGSYKEVYALDGCPFKVYYTATNRCKTASLEEEIAKVKTIRKRVLSNKLNPKNLALSYEKSKVLVEGKVTYSCDKASSDLEKTIKDRLSLTKRIDLCYQALSGVTTLHATGQVHQDLKPENFLVYGSNVKLSDFGWARDLHAKHTVWHRIGDGAHSAPEYTMSHKAEVFSMGLICINILEQSLLQRYNQPTLIAPSSSLKGTGVTAYLSATRNTNRWMLSIRPLKLLLRLFFGFLNALGITYQKEQNELHRYIDALTSQLQDAHLSSRKQAKNIGDCLKQMTAADPKARPTAAAAAAFFRSELPFYYRIAERFSCSLRPRLP
ncbi:MAG: hypothetical protein RLZZ453_766 [Chlamydiota bacterium]|jgi:serine/threonine protein kinase